MEVLNTLGLILKTLSLKPHPSPPAQLSPPPLWPFSGIGRGHLAVSQREKHRDKSALLPEVEPLVVTLRQRESPSAGQEAPTRLAGSRFFPLLRVQPCPEGALF